MIAVATIVMVATAAVFVYSTVYTPSVPVRITIKPGASTNDIAEILSDRGVVRSTLLFKLYVKKQRADSKLQSGDYHMRTGMSNEEALALLLKGPYIKYYRVTIPEGLTVEETAAAVDKASPISEEDFLQAARKELYDLSFLDEIPDESLEGYLFPKTYTVTGRTKAKDLVWMMLRQFEKETAGLGTSYAESKGLDLHNVITIASMIEKEVKVANERELVSEVIYNRLRNNMALQIDATVQYALPDRKESLSYSDLAVDSPYNTYLHTGLPPGPIASPGLASIEAALHPKEGNYLYYVLTGEDGSHTFTATAEEFERVKREHGR